MSARYCGAGLLVGEGGSIVPVLARCLHEGDPIYPGEMVGHRTADGRYEVVGANARSGPAKVSTDEYRSGWDHIFGDKQEVGQA